MLQNPVALLLQDVLSEPLSQKRCIREESKELSHAGEMERTGDDLFADSGMGQAGDALLRVVELLDLEGIWVAVVIDCGSGVGVVGQC